MQRKRITEVMPFLLPLRIKQRQLTYFTKMKYDNNVYAKIKGDYLTFQTSFISKPVINHNSGFDIKFQENKLHNLKLISKVIDKTYIKQDEVFSFALLLKKIQASQLKDGLVIINGEMKSESGGGICQLSNQIYEAALHSELTIIERHPHKSDYFKSEASQVMGLDATINSGWLDLKIKNETSHLYQLKCYIKNEQLIVEILSDQISKYDYSLLNDDISFTTINNQLYKTFKVIRKTIDKSTNRIIDIDLISEDTIKIKY